MECQKFHEDTPLLKEDEIYSLSKSKNWNKDKSQIKVAVTVIKEEDNDICQNDSVLSLSEADTISMEKHTYGKERVYEDCINGKLQRQDNVKNILVKVCSNISIKQNKENDERLDTEAKSKRVRAEKALEDHSCLVNNEFEETFGSSNRVNKDTSTINLLQPLQHYSICKLLALSLRHMVKAFLKTLPIITGVCLIAFCLSKLPYTNDCEKYPKNFDCTYYNENLVFGVNSIVMLVSTGVSYLLSMSRYINCNKGGNNKVVVKNF